MRNPTPYVPLHGVPLDLLDGDGDEYDDHSCFPGGGLCWPDDPLDKVIGYVSVLDDGFLEALGIHCSPAPAPGGSRDEDDESYSWSTEGIDVDMDVGALAAESALCGKRSACDMFDGLPELAPTMRDGGFGTCAAAMAGFVAEEEALALQLPERAPSCSTSTMTSTASSCPELSPTSMSWLSLSPASCKTESPEHAFLSCARTLPRKRRSRPAATVRKRPWSLATPLPLVLMPAATLNSHGDNNNGNDDRDDEVSHHNSGGGGNVRRCSVMGRQQSRQGQRTCDHCQSSETPQWRAGPDGPGTLCNACGIRYKMGKLYPEYRPSTSPFFSSHEHSNRHRKVVKLREKKLKVMAPGLPPVPVTPNTGEVLRPCKYNN